jgi:hypothetical protein
MVEPAAAPSTPPAPSPGAPPAAADRSLSDTDFGDHGASGKPEKPELYKAELPSDFALPQGVEYRFDDKDPTLAEARKLVHEVGLDQATFSKLLGLHAKAELAQAQRALAEVVTVERSLPNFEPRKTAINKFLDANLPADQAAAIKASVSSGPAFLGLEQLISRASGRASTSTSSASASSNEKSWADRMWPRGFDPNPQQRRAG